MNAKTLGDELIKNGMQIVSGGTDSHLLLIDLTNLNVTGKAMEKGLEKCHITVNKNTVPKEKRSPFVTSGIRVGTPALTTRGMKEEEMKIIAKLIAKVAKNVKDDEGTIDEDVKNEIISEVKELARKFPLYKELLD
jgi:glycine hydroxymethyltransferase